MGKFALRSELGKLMRIARFSRPDAFYGASISAKTSESLGRVVLNPIDIEVVSDVNIADAVVGINFPQNRRIWRNFGAAIKRCDRSQFSQENKKGGGSKTPFRLGDLLQVQKAIRRIKSGR